MNHRAGISIKLFRYGAFAQNRLIIVARLCFKVLRGFLRQILPVFLYRPVPRYAALAEHSRNEE